MLYCHVSHVVITALTSEDDERVVHGSGFECRVTLKAGRLREVGSRIWIQVRDQETRPRHRGGARRPAPELAVRRWPRSDIGVATGI